MALAYLENYREAVLKAVETRSVHEIVPHGGHGPIQEILGTTAIATQAQLLKAKTRRKADGMPLIRRTDTVVDISPKRFDEVAAALESHGQSAGQARRLQGPRRGLRDRRRGESGSAPLPGTRRGAGPPDGYHLLDIKECQAFRGRPVRHGYSGRYRRRGGPASRCVPDDSPGARGRRPGCAEDRPEILPNGRDDSRREPLQLGPVPGTA